MQCSLFFVFLKNWMAVKLSIYLPSDFLFGFSGPRWAVFPTLFADFSFRVPRSRRRCALRVLSLQTNLPGSACFLLLWSMHSNLSLQVSLENFEITCFQFYTYVPGCIKTNLRMNVRSFGSKPTSATMKSGHKWPVRVLLPHLQITCQFASSKHFSITMARFFCLRWVSKDMRFI